MNLCEAKHATYQLWEQGYDEELFSFLCSFMGTHSILDKKPLRKEVQKYFKISKDEAKEKLKGLLLKLQNLGLGKTEETVEGKQFLFAQIYIADGVELVLSPNCIQTWINDISGLKSKTVNFGDAFMEMNRSMSKTSLEIQYELEDLVLPPGADLWTHIAIKYGVVLDPRAHTLDITKLSELIVSKYTLNYLAEKINKILISA